MCDEQGARSLWRDVEGSHFAGKSVTETAQGGSGLGEESYGSGIAAWSKARGLVYPNSAVQKGYHH